MIRDGSTAAAVDRLIVDRHLQLAAIGGEGPDEEYGSWLLHKSIYIYLYISSL